MSTTMSKAWLACGVLALLGGTPSMAQAAAPVIAVRLVMTDVQGTPVMKTDLQGNILARYDYRPYGAQQSGPVEAGPGYTGHVNDPDTGLVYMQQRYYDPEVGRFLSVDSVGSGASNLYNFNRYAYADNNPLINVDPDGRTTIDTHSACSMYDCQTFVSGGESEGARAPQSSKPPSTAAPTSTSTSTGGSSANGTGLAPFQVKKQISSTSKDTDSFARETSESIVHEGKGNNNEVCGRMCPSFDQTGALMGYTSAIGTNGSPAWCQAPVCNGGGLGMAGSHSHARTKFIANTLDFLGNKFALPGTLQNTSTERFSPQDKSLPIPQYLIGRKIHKYDPASNQESIVH